MRYLKAKIAYDGSCYHGFQRQDNALAVQQVIEKAISALTGESVSINGCSRTDTGVHAREFFMSFKMKNPIPCEGFVRGMNSLLPEDIAVINCEECSEDFHARYNCKGKEYEYIIFNSRSKNPFLKNRAYRYSYPIDEKLLDDAAKAFVGTHDFKGFCCADCDKENTTRTVYDFSVSRNGDIISMKVSADGFLYNMVRIMVGTLLYINEGKLSKEDIVKLFDSRDRTKAGVTVPPHGLYLNKVFY